MLKPTIENHSDQSLEFILSEIERKVNVSNSLISSPINDQQIDEIQRKFGFEFPLGYINFLKITNGFKSPDEIEPDFFPASKITFFRDAHPETLDIWKANEILGELLESAILVADFAETQFLLIPPQKDYVDWQYWSFSPYNPGEQPYSSIKSYFIDVLESLD